MLQTSVAAAVRYVCRMMLSGSARTKPPTTIHWYPAHAAHRGIGSTPNIQVTTMQEAAKTCCLGSGDAVKHLAYY